MLVGPKLFRSCTGRTQVYFGSCTTNDPRLFWVLQHAKPKDSWVLMQPQRHVCAGVCPAHALGLLRTQVDSPSIQGWADRVSGGCSLGRGLGVRSPGGCVSSLAFGACWLQPHTCPTKQCSSH
jgi:hypothetical protein